MKTLIFVFLVSSCFIYSNARPVTGDDDLLMAVPSAIGMSVGNLNANFTLSSEGGQDNTNTVQDINSTSAATPNKKPFNPNDPNITFLIKEWLSLAEPPINAIKGAHTKYEPWGRIIGKTRTATLTVTTKPDDVGNRSSAEYLWSLCDKLDSVDHCTLGEYVRARLDNKSITHCKGRYNGVATKTLDAIEKEIYSMENFAKESTGKCVREKQILDKLQKQIALEKNSYSDVEKQIDYFVESMNKTEKFKTHLVENTKKIEELAVEIGNILTNLGDLSLNICKKTKTLNDYKIKDDLHQKTFEWIQRNKKELKNYLDKIKVKHKKIQSYKIIVTEMIKKHNSRKTVKTEKIDDVMNKMDIFLKDIDTTLALTNEMLIKNLQNVSKVYSRKQAIKKTLKRLKEDKKYGKVLTYEINRLYKKLNVIASVRCSKDLEAIVVDIQSSAKKINKESIVITKQMNENRKQIKEYTQNIEKIKSLEKNRNITLLLVENYILRAKRFSTDGALCSVLSEKIMKKVFIPNVIGMKRNEALRTLENVGLTNLSTSLMGESPSKMTEKEVLTQRPETKKRVKKETPIILTHYGYYISEAKKSEALKNELMSQKTCMKNTVKRWNEIDKKVDCICEGPAFVWNQTYTACITQKEADLENNECWKKPGSKPVRYANGNIQCECPIRTWWSESLHKCASSYEINQECNKLYPGSIPANNTFGCGCPNGIKWLDHLYRCADSNYCSQTYPGSIPSNHSSGCTCPNGTTWMDGMNRCSNLNSIAQYCNQQFPGSIPEWSQKHNKQGCGCPKGTRPINNRCIKAVQNTQEICGDGIDNNGNNQIDEGCNYNLQVILDDDECPDDTMALIVDGHNLGNNPAGHKRHYNVTGLSKGQHKIEVYGVKSGGDAYKDKKGKACGNQNIITYSIEFGHGIKAKNGRKKSSSRLKENQSKSYSITVQ